MSDSINATPTEETDVNVHIMAVMWLSSHHNPGSRILIQPLV